MSLPIQSNNDALFVQQDVSDLSGSQLADIFGDGTLRLLAGCAPCQPFSTYSRKGRQERQDTKWVLVSDFGRLVRETQPDFVTMENVPQLLEHEVFKDFLKDLEGYATRWQYCRLCSIWSSTDS
jgi:DNA (cytosine-5)-methyltransferase 1